MLRITLILTSLLSFHTIAQESESDKLNTLLANINKVDLESVTQSQADEWEKQYIEYRDFKEKQCSGEYASFMFLEGDKKKQQIKLSKKERQLCMANLIKIRIQITTTLFEFKKVILNKEYLEADSTLEVQKNKSIKDLQRILNKLSNSR